MTEQETPETPRDHLAELTGGFRTKDGFGHDWSESDYYRDRYTRIGQGHPTWMVRNFDGEGLAIDYYVNKKPFALLYIGGFSDAHEVYPSEDQFETFRFDDFGEAVERVEKLAREVIQ